MRNNEESLLRSMSSRIGGVTSEIYQCFLEKRCDESRMFDETSKKIRRGSEDSGGLNRVICETAGKNTSSRLEFSPVFLMMASNGNDLELLT